MQTPCYTRQTKHSPPTCYLEAMLQRKRINVLLSNLGWGPIPAPTIGRPWVIAASYLIIIQVFLFSSSVFF